MYVKVSIFNTTNLKAMKLTKINHKNQLRIRIDFQYDAEVTAAIRQIADTHWSKTLKCWHIPYTSKAFKQLMDLFPNAEYENTRSNKAVNETTARETTSKNQQESSTNSQNTTQKLSKAEHHNVQWVPKDDTAQQRVHVFITFTTKKIFVQLQKNETDTQFIRSFKYVYWDCANRQWIIPNYGRNLALLKDYFSDRKITITEQVNRTIVSEQQSIVQAHTLKVVNIQNRILRIYFTYNPTLMNTIKKIGLSRWNSAENCWTVPYQMQNVDILQELAQNNGHRWEYQIVSKTEGLARMPRHAEYLHCPTEYCEKLKELRYSRNTLNVYTDLFEEFINYYPDKKAEEITEEEVILFLRYLVNSRKVSTSYQNQSINAIKFFYERVLGGNRKIYLIERPRKENYLPEVLSEDEVALLIKSIQNLKHKALIMTIYSGGLRISELINLRIKDIDSDRMQIRISQSKGKKDRYTLLSKKTLLILRDYFKEYNPKEWLFEGENGGQYANRSIQNILRAAVEKTGIKKRITVHTLRHSFATHLLENGTDIRYIQSLLGHSSSKTTEIYTHITTKGFDQIKNPLDKLEI